MSELIHNLLMEGSIKYDFKITPEIKEAFQKCSNDFNPLHNDADFAKRKGFPSEVMYGNILNCFLSYFIGELLPIKDVIIHGQEIQYKAPVFMGDTLAFEAEVKEVVEAVNTVIYSYKFRNSSNALVAKGKIQIGVIQDKTLSD